MPNRFIKESIRTSETLAEISSDAERLFWRLVVSVDDFGRFDARTSTILGQCMTAFLETVSPTQIEMWLRELQNAELIHLYDVEGKRYLVLTSWNKHQRARAKDSKFPPPADARGHPLSNVSNGQQAQSSAGSNVFVFDNENDNENEIGFENDNDNDNGENGGNGDFQRLADEYQQIFVTGMNSIQQQDLRKLMDEGMEVDLMIEDFRTAARNNAGFSYAHKIIMNQFQGGIKTLAEYEAVQSRKESAAGGENAGFHFRATAGHGGPNGRTRSITGGKFGKV